MIINVSNPSDPFFVTSVTYDANYPELFAPYDITTVKIDTSTFAIVVSQNGDGVQIIDITDPDNPIPASAIADDVDGYTEATSVTTVTLGGPNHKHHRPLQPNQTLSRYGQLHRTSVYVTIDT